MNILHVLADTIDPGSIGLHNQTTDAGTAINNVLSIVYTWAGIIAVIVIIVAGYLYVTSGGNASQTKKAKDAILGAVIGLIVVMLAFVITEFVLGKF